MSEFVPPQTPALGWASVGPVVRPDELPEAFDRALAAIDHGQPALIDVLVDPTIDPGA